MKIIHRYSRNEDWYNKEVAKNSNTSPEILTRILRRGNDDYVSWDAVQNPNCPPEMLVEILKRGKDNTTSYYAVENPNCPPEILVEILRRENNDAVSRNAAFNQNVPPEILAEVLKRGNDDFVSRNVAKNPNCPSEILAEVLKRGNDDIVSQYAAKNPNCPPEAKIQWMRDTGQIGKEDPNKHVIEYGGKEEINKDLDMDLDMEKLKQLISNNKFNLKRCSQNVNEDWYNKEVAENPNTPPEMLTRILKMKKNDVVSQYAANNPNTPPEMLVEILKRENDNGVSQNAARNPNTPPEILAEVLRRGNEDFVFQYAVRNPNIPPEVKIQWMRDTGRIGKEDPSKHIIEYDSKEEVDTDLEKLKQLVSNNFNLRKYSQTQKEDREYPVAAAVLAAGKIFKGRSHLDALLKAIKAGYAMRNKDGDIVDKDGIDMTLSGATDLFLTNKGRIIDRIESMRMGEALVSENIPEEDREMVANTINMLRMIKSEKVEAYHGTPASFSKFDIGKSGDGYDQEGPGLYFSNDKDDAAKYMEKGKLFHVYLNFNKTVPLEGEVNVEEIKKLILWTMDLENEEQLENVDMDKFYESSLSDYGEDSFSAFIEAVNNILEYTNGPHDAFQQIWIDYYRYNPTKYLNNMIKLGYDGVIIPKEEGRVHYVVFNTNIIEILS